MGRPFKQYLEGPRIYSCSTCRSHVADHDDIISKVLSGDAAAQKMAASACRPLSCFLGSIQHGHIWLLTLYVAVCSGIPGAPWARLPFQQCVSILWIYI